MQRRAGSLDIACISTGVVYRSLMLHCSYSLIRKKKAQGYARERAHQEPPKNCGFMIIHLQDGDHINGKEMEEETSMRRAQMYS
jgi:hypothetical protein